MSRFVPVLLVLGSVLAVEARSAQAQGVGGGWGGGGYAAFYGFNGGAGPYNLYDNERVVPHFMLYPPVYYSVPVPRTYGWSPFAYPPGMMTPEVSPPTPQRIENRQVPQKTSVAPSDRTAQTPLVIDNPYVVSVDRGGEPLAGGPASSPADAALSSAENSAPAKALWTRLAAGR